MIRIGIVGMGAGSIGQKVYVPSLRRLRNAHVVAVASRSGAAFDEQTPVYADWADMLEREAMDALFVLTPTAMHRQIATAAFARGLHVLCEKPPALTVADAEAIVDAARRVGRSILFGFNRRFAPSYVRLKQIADGHGCHTLIMEKTRRYTGQIGDDSFRALDAQWTAEAHTRGTPIFEFMVHLFHIALWINGPVARYSFFPRPLYGSTVNLTSSGWLEHTSGSRTVLLYDHTAGDNREHVFMYGPALTVEVGNGLFARTYLTLAEHGQTTTELGPEDTVECSGFLPMCQHLVDSIAAGRRVVSDPADAIEALRLALAFDPPPSAP